MLNCGPCGFEYCRVWGSEDCISLLEVLGLQSRDWALFLGPHFTQLHKKKLLGTEDAEAGLAAGSRDHGCGLVNNAA